MAEEPKITRPRWHPISYTVRLTDGRTGLALWLDTETDQLDVMPVQDFTSPISMSHTEHVRVSADRVHPLPPRSATYQGTALEYGWVPPSFRRCDACGHELGVFAYSTGAELRQPSSESAAAYAYCDLCIDAPVSLNPVS